MDQAGMARTRAHVGLHDHAIHVYEKEADLLRGLGAFIEEGLRRRESTVFVHCFLGEEDAWRFVARAHPDAPRLRRDRLVLVRLYKDALEGASPRIDHAHVDHVVASLLAGARQDGRTGVRIFVDASRRYFAQGRADEWFRFESWLGRRLHADMALVCAYQAADVMRPEILPQVLDTHAYRFGA